ncbi:hypothetical protein V1515DRAFT_579360 [Lipomyces mesembrius]
MTELDAIAKLIGYDSAYTLELQGFVIQEFRIYQPTAKSNTLEKKYFYAQVSCLFILRRATTEESYNLAIVAEFIDVDYPDGKADEFYGRVIAMRSRSLSGPTCIHVEDIQCTIGIVRNSFTAEDYILDRKWDIFDAHEDEFELFDLAGHEDSSNT